MADIDKIHLEELIAEAEGDAEYDIPEGPHLQDALAEFAAAGYEVPQPTDGAAEPGKVPWGAIGMRAFEPRRGR